MKECRRCKEVKSLAEFPRDKTRKDGLYSYCKVCQNQKSKLWNRENPERRSEIAKRSYRNNRGSEKRREYALKTLYRLSPEEFDQIAEKQGHKCAICKKEKKLCVDHSHETGKVRGLLCRTCNSAIGLLGELNGVLNAAIYLTANT